MLQRALSGGHTSLSKQQQLLGGFATPYPGTMTGTMTPGFSTSTRIDLNQIGEARNSMLGIKLDQVMERECVIIIIIIINRFLTQFLVRQWLILKDI